MKSKGSVLVLFLGLIVIVLAAGIYACAGIETANIEGKWVLESYGRPGALKPAETEREAWIEFKKKDNQVGGNAGVNIFGGHYKVDGSKLEIDSVVMTEMAGPENLMAQEAGFLKILASAETFKIEGPKLTITGTEGILVFKR